MRKETFDNCELYCGNCMDIMPALPPSSVDLVLTDPPYGITENEWDKVISPAPMWGEINRISKDKTPQVLFGLFPFSFHLINSNLKNYRYMWIWYKHSARGFLSANKRPLKVHEEILVFSKKEPSYYPIKIKGKLQIKHRGTNSSNYNMQNMEPYTTRSDLRFPVSILDFPAVSNGNLHPTQKPVTLMEYLVNTYTKERDIVLDFTMGSGTTGVACVRNGRKFIGIELNEKYFDIACRRIEAESKQLKFDFQEVTKWR